MWRERYLNFLLSMLLLWHLGLLKVKGFNLEQRIPIIKQGEKGSYFGYSVAQHQIVTSGSMDPVILVGAPRARPFNGRNNSGVIYRCPLSTTWKDCAQLRAESDDSSHSSIKDDQWLGVSLKSKGKGGFVMTCAHRYIEKAGESQWGFGVCYSLNQQLEYRQKWYPCGGRPVNKGHEQFGYCQAGTSLDVLDDNNMVLGSPGPYTWRGTVFVNNLGEGIRDDKTWYLGPLDESPVDKYSYLGMAVTSGKFFGEHKSFVAGAPRSNGTGQVVFFRKEQRGITVLSVELLYSGRQFASSFGYSLTALDINHDGYDDLVVGAPFYFSDYEGGAIYVYLSSDKGIGTKTVPTNFTGKPESRFGFAVASAGDLNKDGFTDLAVGAPYENNGVVYIYLGSTGGLITEPSQVIQASDFPKQALSRTSFATFGYSISGGLDLDQNGYPDLLIGSYDSDTVSLLLGRPIIDVITTVEGNLKNIDATKPGCAADPSSTLVCFSFKACFKFNSSVLSHGTRIKIKYRIEAEPRRKFYRVYFQAAKDSETPNIVEKDVIFQGESLGSLECSTEVVYLRDKSDIQNPINFKLTYTLIQNEPKMPEEGERLPNVNLYPILNQQEASKNFQATFMKNCGTDDICQSDLEFDVEFNLPNISEPEQVFYSGEIKGETAMKKEDDIGSSLRHVYSLYNNGPSRVRQVDVVISWPYEIENEKKHGKWLLYMVGVPTVSGQGACVMSEKQVNPLDIEVDEDDDISNDLDIHPIDERRRRKRATRIEPKSERIDGKSTKVVYLDCEEGTAKCFTFVCTLLNVEAKSTSLIKIRARLWNSSLVEDYSDVDLVSIKSRGHIDTSSLKGIRNDPELDKAFAETKAYPEISLIGGKGGVPWWVILLAVLGGLILLIALIIILFKCGFFKRKRPGYEPAPLDEKETNNI
ncbi:integrin alpha-PS1-like [Limulus polyphemus]|uniref:Integrin alpha-PS1-like n=1 Tax=Limulus polyphemus TaxID=6850 RepID=A0ABM1BG99_LIMPO|nr:integrin alpha-PS1-like [Limulus polyphemus]